MAALNFDQVWQAVQSLTPQQQRRSRKLLDALRFVHQPLSPEVDVPTNGGHPVKSLITLGVPSIPRTRRTCLPEFKGESVKLVTEQRYSLVEAARSLGLNQKLIRNWKQALYNPRRTRLFRMRKALPL